MPDRAAWPAWLARAPGGVLVVLAFLMLTAAGDAKPAREWPGVLSGHGGPVRSVETDGRRVLTASFDYSAILWAITDGKAEIVHRLVAHRAGVNDAAMHGDRAITASDDSSVVIWDLVSGAPVARHAFGGEKAVAVAVSHDGSLAASAHWDGAARLYDMASGDRLAELSDHRGNVNDVAFSHDGTRLYTASQDGRVLEWSLGPKPTSRPFTDRGWNVNVIAPLMRDDGEWLAVGAVDGSVVAVSMNDPSTVREIVPEGRPIMALAASDDGAFLAIGDGGGMARVARTSDWTELAAVTRPGPVWGLAFADEANLLLTGLDDRVFTWQAQPNAPLATAPEAFPRRFQSASDDLGERQFARKCSVCHTLTPDSANRAGPTLHGLFGREVASLPDYPYSDAMRGMDIVWTPETVGLLFEHGPDNYTPGSKMPMQRITDDRERAALIAFLERATALDATTGEP